MTFDISIFKLSLFNIILCGAYYLPRDEDGVDEISKLTMEGFMVFPPMKMKERFVGIWK